MTGAVSWEQLWAIVGVIVAVAVASFIMAWRINSWMASDRKVLELRLEKEVMILEARLASLENFQAGTLVVLKHIDEFRVEVKGQYEMLREQRRTDMEGIHRRLDAMHNAARLLTSISNEGLGDANG